MALSPVALPDFCNSPKQKRVWIVPLDQSYKLYAATDRHNHMSPRGNLMNLGPFLLIAIVLLLAWAGGFLIFHVASALIHLLLVLAILSLVFHFVTGRRTV